MRRYTSIPYGIGQEPSKFNEKIIEMSQRLEKNPEFQKFVSDIRRKWNIPKKGLKD
jgi:hypothetical protein